MPVNEFEKQVKQKLDELQLRPSGGVWEEVEKHIRKEKKRRVAIFWLFLCGLLVGGGILYFITLPPAGKLPVAGTSQETVKGQDKTTDKTGIPSSPEQDNIPATTPPGNRNTDNTDNNNNPDSPVSDNHSPVSIPVPVTRRPQPGEGNTGNAGNKNNTGNTSLPANNNSARPLLQRDAQLVIETKKSGIARRNTGKKQTAPAGQPLEKELPDEKKADPGRVQAPVATDVVVSPDPPAQSPETVIIGIPATTDSVSRNEETAKAEAPALPLVDRNENNKPGKQKKPGKWAFGLELRPGISNVQWGGLLERYTFATPGSNTGGFGSSVTGNPQSLGPSNPTLIYSPVKGVSLGVQVFAQRSLGPRFDLQGGIQYSYLDSRIKVGSRVPEEKDIANTDLGYNVTVSGYYNVSNGVAAFDREYTNKYHLLGLSTSLAWKFLRIKDRYIAWDNGISVTRLLHTNALLYNAGIRGYYEDKKAHRQTQLFVSSGLSVPVLEKKKFSLAVRPFASYGITPVLRSSAFESHYINLGVGLKFLWKK